MKLKFLQGALIVAIALYLVPTGAHLFELPAKMALPASDYMIVQRIYYGWQAFGFIIGAALLLSLVHAYFVRGSRAALVAALVGFVALAAALADFVLFTLPVNVATNFWTVVPEPFETARRQWEYSHAAAAVLTFIALIATLASVQRHNGNR